MSFIRITEPNVAAVPLDDLGITVAQNEIAFVITNQFSIQDLYVSADLEAAIINGDITVEIDYGTGFQAVAAGDYTNRDALGAFLNIYEITNENNNEDLVDGSDINASGPGSTPLHIHDARYYTETEVGSTATGSSGGTLVGVDDTNFTTLIGEDVQTVFDNIDDLFTSFDLDNVYDNDVDGILNVDGTTKDLDLRSDNVNDVVISRINTTVQDILRADISADELHLGALSDVNNDQFDVRVLSDLYVDGNITFVGTITDTTVANLNVTNAEILLRDGATVGGDAALKVERGSTGADACISWNETSDRWEAGVVGAKFVIPGLETDEDIQGVWCFGGVDTTEPNMCLVEKTSTPTTNLGAAGDIPMAMMPGGILSVYDKSNSRNKFLSVSREYMRFAGRNNANNSNEYARIGEIPSNNTGDRLIVNKTLVGMSISTKGAETWTAEVRKNDVVTVLASLGATAVAGAQTATLNIDFNAGDDIQVFINGSSVDRPVIKLEFAQRF